MKNKYMYNSKRLIEDVAFAMENNLCFSVIKVESMEVLMIPEDEGFWTEDNEEEFSMIMNDEDEEGEYIRIGRCDSNDGYRLMEDFADGLEECRVKSDLFRALAGNKPFRTFRFVLDGDDEYLQRWYRFKEEYYRAKAKEFLEENKVI